MQDKITVFRLDNKDSKRGLWYNPSGDYKGEIINDFTSQRASNLAMPYDENLANGWRSATKTAKELLDWFNVEEITQLEEHGFFVSIYSTTKYKTYIHKVPNSDIEIPHLIFRDTHPQSKKLISVQEFSQMLS